MINIYSIFNLAVNTGILIYHQHQIFFLIQTQGKRLEASAVTCSIVSKLKELQDFAMLGNKTPLSSLNEKKYLMLMIDKYACIYRKVENTVYIYHITMSQHLLQVSYPVCCRQTQFPKDRAMPAVISSILYVLHNQSINFAFNLAIASSPSKSSSKLFFYVL